MASKPRDSRRWAFYTSVKLRQVGEPIENPGVELRRLETPGPVALRLAGKVHTRFRAEIQDVLHRRNCTVRHRCPGYANQVPGGVAAIAGQVAAHVIAILVRR